jgi:hypothetical protein
MQEAEGVGTERIDHGVQVELADPLERARHEGVGRGQLGGGRPLQPLQHNV